MKRTEPQEIYPTLFQGNKVLYNIENFCSFNYSAYRCGIYHELLLLLPEIQALIPVAYFAKLATRGLNTKTLSSESGKLADVFMNNLGNDLRRFAGTPFYIKFVT